jgi:hypothetical protein
MHKAGYNYLWESLALPVILARRGPPEGSPPITPGTCRSKACALGLRARPRKMNDVHEIRVSDDVFALLKDDAVQRGLTVQRFASLVLSAVALDRLFDAVIDDDHARNRKLKAAKKNGRRSSTCGGKTACLKPPRANVAFGSKADMRFCAAYVCF